MLGLVKICFCVSVFIRIVHCDWVEIPQFSNKNSYIGVTPYNPYIYEKTIFFSTTPSTYDTIREPEAFETPYTEQKKSITKLPDSIVKNVLTTEISVSMKTTLRPPHTQVPTKPTTTSTVPIFKATINYHKKSNETNNTTKSNIKKINRRNDTADKLKNSTKTTTTQNPKHNLDLDSDEQYEEILYEDDEEYDDNLDGVGEEYYDDTEYDDEEDEPEGATQKGDSNGYTYVSFIPYLQNIQSTLMRNSHKNVKGKISFLTEIKNRLLYAIKEKISSIWSPKSKRRHTRSTRGDHYASWEKGDSGMDFPSNEGALLTIGFLTFAVFLIKCILKLIHAIKGKNHGYHKGVMMVPMSMMSMVTPATTGRKRRGIDEQIHILDLIDNYKFQ